jgi:molybdopterin-guanine dinucleotide biosynthesis protein A
MIDNITGVVLAGGKSSRMGQNKALLPFHDKPLIEIVAEKLASIFSRVVLSVSDPNAFPHIGLPRIVDRYPERGPMGGITSVLESGEKNTFCVACDMPFLNTALIERICTFAKSDAVVPVWHDRPEVLHALYSASLEPTFRLCLTHGLYKIIDAIEESQVTYLLESEIVKFDPQGHSFRNINTPIDYNNLTNP